MRGSRCNDSTAASSALRNLEDEGKVDQILDYSAATTNALRILRDEESELKIGLHDSCDECVANLNEG